LLQKRDENERLRNQAFGKSDNSSRDSSLDDKVKKLKTSHQNVLNTRNHHLLAMAETPSALQTTKIEPMQSEEKLPAVVNTNLKMTLAQSLKTT